MLKLLKSLPYIVLLLLASSILSWFILGKLWFMPVSLIVKQLEQTLPWLETQGLTAYRNQSWCENIAYNAGFFSKTNSPSTCNLFDGEAQAFSPQARADFQILRYKLRPTGARVAFINAYYESGSLQSVIFNLNCLWCPRTRYVYESSYVLPDNLANELWYKPINQDWYQVGEDWN